MEHGRRCITFPPSLPPSFTPPSPPLLPPPPPQLKSPPLPSPFSHIFPCSRLCPTVTLCRPPRTPCFFLTFLASIVTLGHILSPKDLSPGSTNIRKDMTFVFLALSYLAYWNNLWFHSLIWKCHHFLFCNSQIVIHCGYATFSLSICLLKGI